MNLDAKIFVAGHRGLVGSAIVRALKEEGFRNLLLKGRKDLDLENTIAVQEFFQKEKPEFVIIAAAKVGGIMANASDPVAFFTENINIQNNIMVASKDHGVQKLLFLGSSCIYPKYASQPMKESSLLTGLLEPTNDAYAIAKIAGIKLCDACNRQYGSNFFSVMPTNMYGIGDRFDLERSHVLPAMLRKFHLAKLAVEGKWKAIKRDEELFGKIPLDIMFALEKPSPSVVLWGSGKPRREFLFNDDFAKACVYLLKQVNASDLNSRASLDENPCALVNVGFGSDVSLRDLAKIICKIVGFEGEVQWDSSKPDGTMHKLMDSGKINGLGWRAKTSLHDGIDKVYQWYLSQFN